MVSFRLAFVPAFLAMTLTSVVASADGREDTARAETLFKEARRLMNAGDFAAACPKFADSQRIEPAPGTALNLALCYEKAGKLASAWAAFRSARAAAQAARQLDRVKIAGEQAEKLEPTLSHLTISVPPEVSVAGFEVRCDGALVSPPEWGVAIPWDGGGHDIEVSAPGKKTWRTHVELASTRQNLKVDVPALENSDTPPPAEAPPPPKVTGEAPPEVPASPSASSGKTNRVLGMALGGLGVLGLGVGTYAGLTARSTYNDAAGHCPGSPPTCPAGSPALAQRDSASTWAAVSTVGFVAGGALLAAGTLLYFTAPKGTATPAVGIAPAPGGAAISLAGRFQ